MLCLLVLLSLTAAGADWPAFRGPEANPVGADLKLADRWSKTENVEWVAEIPGRGWSSPVVTGERVFLTAAVTEGVSKKPQVGTEYSNEYAAELAKQGLSEKQIMEKINERDFELPDQVMLHYFLYCVNLKTGKVEWKREFYAGHPPGGEAPQEQLYVGDAGDRWEERVCVCGQSGNLCV
jgi:hypothetical protein